MKRAQRFLALFFGVVLLGFDDFCGVHEAFANTVELAPNQLAQVFRVSTPTQQVLGDLSPSFIMGQILSQFRW
jgi:hypothetical protein